MRTAIAEWIDPLGRRVIKTTGADLKWDIWRNFTSPDDTRPDAPEIWLDRMKNVIQAATIYDCVTVVARTDD